MPPTPAQSLPNSQLAQGQLLNHAHYEENLLHKEGCNSGDVEIMKNGQYLRLVHSFPLWIYSTFAIKFYMYCYLYV